jgi:hypothetical protein
MEGILSNGIINNAGVPRPRLPTAVTIKERIVVLNVQSNRKSVSHGFLAGIFGTLDRFGVVVDLISTSEVFVSMALEDVLDRKLQARLVRDLEKIGIVRFFLSLSVFRPRSQLVALRLGCALARAACGATILGIRTSRYGDTLDGRKTDAQYGRHRGTHVHDSGTGKRQH